MKEECTLCSVNGFGGGQTTDFSISSLMRPTVHQGQMEQRPDALLLSAYLFKLGDYQLYTHDNYAGTGKMSNNCICQNNMPASPSGYYQPAGPLIKDNGEERALARYHPTPHYHPPHPPVLQQYGPYYPADLCYSRYYRTPAPYHMPPPQPEPQMVGVNTEPYPPQYYATPPCYQHSPQRIPYVEFRGCPCPLNACPKNVLIGPATGKAPTGGGPADVSSALAPQGASFRPKVRACTLDVAADNAHGSGKDPPLADVEPPAGADAPHPCPLPAIGGASPKREIYDMRENLRIGSDMPGPTEVLGPPSPARGSAGACAPQPPPGAPRRARLGKEMAWRSLVGEDTGLLLSAPRPPVHHADADDDVLAISPPACVPIDLSSSDERSTPLVDVKKENEGPTYSSPRKLDAQALKEHNCSAALSDALEDTGAAKAVKRRYSKPKLEIDMIDVHLEEGCKTNGIGEHVKLQKRRKVSSDQSELLRSETVTKDTKKRNKTKRVTKSPPTEKKSTKRKLDNNTIVSSAKKHFEIDVISEDPRLKNVAAITEEPIIKKHKSALLLDNLLRKNSIDRPDVKGLNSDTELNPAELFLPSKENPTINSIKSLNIIKEKTINGVRPNTIELLGKKLANKNMPKSEKIGSKIIHNTVLKPASPVSFKKDNKIKDDYEPCLQDDLDISSDVMDYKLSDITKCETVGDKLCEHSLVDKTNLVAEKLIKSAKVLKTKSIKSQSNESDGKINESQKLVVDISATHRDQEKKECKNKSIVDSKDKSEEQKPMKRCKLTEKSGEVKSKTVEKVKLLVSKKPAIKTDEASLVVEEACAGAGGARARAGRGRGSGRRGRRALAPVAPPAAPRAHPRWSNGWDWDGEPYISKVYLNNDSRMDRWARCWARMRHAGGDSVARGDCVLLRASPARAQPFVARVARLWLNPDDGEMMVSLVWYYRPEHTEMGRQPADAPDEVFASRHRDANSVACIEDKCYVLTFNEYCRYRKRLKAVEEGITMPPSIVPPIPAGEVTGTPETNDTKLPPTVSPELVLFCRKIYDFRSKKIQVPNK